MIRIKEIRTIYPASKRMPMETYAFITVLGNEWIYYIEDEYHRWQEGPYALNKKAPYPHEQSDVEECKKVLRSHLEWVARNLGINFEKIEKTTSLEKITVKSLIESVAILSKKGSRYDLYDPDVYAMKDGTEIYFEPCDLFS